MAKSLIPMPIEVGQGLPMTDRDRSVTWIRKTMTQEKSNHGKNDIHPLPTFRTSQALKSLEHYIKSSNASSEIKLKPADDGFWWLNPHHKTSAVLGRVLYPMKNTTSKKKQGSLLDEMVSHRVFTSDLPNLRRSLETREANMSAKEELYIRLSAAPNPSSGGLESAKLPNLELQFRILIPESTFKRRKAVLKGVRLVLEDKQADLLLPHEQADLRFQHQTYLNSKEDPDPRIMDFVKSSHLDRTDVHHIETPQLLAIEIPRRILFPDQVPKQVDGPNIQIHYSPTSIERRYILQNRPGLNARTRQADLSYATIDAGLIGGRRQEIRFFSDRPGKSDPQLTTDEEGTKVERKSTVKALFKSAIDMIRALRAEAQDGPKPVSKRSLRRMRRVIQGHRGTPLGQKLLRERVRGHMPRAEDSERLRLHPVVRKQWRDVNHRPTDTLRSRF
ncbi:MAG: hypothetical protein L6R39_006075 [Caloplaca ligustica]|nr:MAG: hypothetical protein L6R39_006075 [Caloplaca ligustica]